MAARTSAVDMEVWKKTCIVKGIVGPTKHSGLYPVGSEEQQRGFKGSNDTVRFVCYRGWCFRDGREVAIVREDWI